MQPPLLDDEYIVYKTKQHWFVFIPYILTGAFGAWLLGSLLFTGFGLAIMIFGLVTIAPLLVYYFSTKAIVTNKRVIQVSGVVHITTETIFIENVEQVVIMNEYSGMGVNYGSLRVASGTPYVEFSQMKNVKELARHVNEQIEEIRKNDAKNDTDNRS